MRLTFLALLVALACSSGCVTKTPVNDSGVRTGKSRTVWFWEKDFWGSKK